jgi:hypothetical protein
MAKKLGGLFSPPLLPIGSPGRRNTLLPKRPRRKIPGAFSRFPHLPMLSCFRMGKPNYYQLLTEQVLPNPPLQPTGSAGG